MIVGQSVVISIIVAQAAEELPDRTRPASSHALVRKYVPTTVCTLYYK